jgi:hypothetical protein
MTTPQAAGSGPVTTTAAERGGARLLLPGQSPAGEYILSVLVKRTYRIAANGTCVRADEDREVLGGDVYWDHPMNSSVRFETDFWPFKVATDVVLNGTAYAPDGEPTTSCVVALQVGDRRKTIDVIGDRFAQFVQDGEPVFTDPEPFTQMPLRYEFAYGGTDVFSDLKVVYPYPRNPLGRGFVVANAQKSVDDLPLPNLEDPDTPISPDTLCVEAYANWGTCPLPASFGWFPKIWRPRALLAGVLPRDRAIEQELRQAFAQLIGDRAQREAYLTHGFRDMDFKFFNGASQGLLFPFLQGGETVATENLSPEGDVTFQLPLDRPKIGLDIGEGVKEPEVALHTVMIHMDEGELDLVWRGAVPYQGPEWLPQMRKTEILVE